METNQNSENATSQGSKNQTDQNKNSKELTLNTNFLEFGYPNKDKEHTYALIYPHGETRGEVAAKIKISYESDSKRPVFTAKDLLGNDLYAPSEKLWELKNAIKQDSVPLLEKAQRDKAILAKAKTEKEKEEPTMQKEAKEIGSIVVDEAQAFGEQGKDIILGTGRENEIKNVRNRKVQKVNERSR